jgi:septal ring factor EnvC (AmiA/AmiB activator)
VPRPLSPGSVPPPAVAAYRLPVAGRLVAGLGEVSPSGVRARGLTFRVAPGAVPIAPVAGTVRYAARFRSFGTVVILDHGDGWTTTLTGLAATPLSRGQTVAAGAPLGRAGTGEPEITVELRRRGRPVDLLALTG